MANNIAQLDEAANSMRAVMAATARAGGYVMLCESCRQELEGFDSCYCRDCEKRDIQRDYDEAIAEGDDYRASEILSYLQRF